MTHAADLPQISVVFIFVNEALSVILRSVHSVVNRTPSRLLKEVILVDDNSDSGRWGQWGTPTAQACWSWGPEAGVGGPGRTPGRFQARVLPASRGSGDCWRPLCSAGVASLPPVCLLLYGHLLLD